MPPYQQCNRSVLPGFRTSHRWSSSDRTPGTWQTLQIPGEHNPADCDSLGSRSWAMISDCGVNVKGQPGRALCWAPKTPPRPSLPPPQWEPVTLGSHWYHFGSMLPVGDRDTPPGGRARLSRRGAPTRPQGLSEILPLKGAGVRGHVPHVQRYKHGGQGASGGLTQRRRGAVCLSRSCS